MITQAEKFAKAAELKFGPNFLHCKIMKSDLVNVEGTPKATCWSSEGEIEVLSFEDGSTYEPTEVQFCKQAPVAA
jgi:hypothetical protein